MLWNVRQGGMMNEQIFNNKIRNRSKADKDQRVISLIRRDNSQNHSRVCSALPLDYRNKRFMPIKPNNLTQYENKLEKSIPKYIISKGEY